MTDGRGGGGGPTGTPAHKQMDVLKCGGGDWGSCAARAVGGA
jgi:hypothetical protein